MNREVRTNQRGSVVAPGALDASATSAHGSQLGTQLHGHVGKGLRFEQVAERDLRLQVPGCRPTSQASSVGLS